MDTSYFEEKQKAIKYPDQVQIKKNIVENVKKTFVGTYDEVQTAIAKAEEDAKTECKRQMNEYHNQEAAVEQEFKKWLFKNYGNKNNKVNEIIYSKAYDDGHSYGYNGIANKFESISDFVDKVLSVVE